MNDRNGSKMLDESLRRMGGIMQSPWLATAYTRTEPRLERGWLRRLGLTRREAERFLEFLCCRGLLDGGARPVVERLCRTRGITPHAAARMLLDGRGWEEVTDDGNE